MAKNKKNKGIMYKIGENPITYGMVGTIGIVAFSWIGCKALEMRDERICGESYKEGYTKGYTKGISDVESEIISAMENTASGNESSENESDDCITSLDDDTDELGCLDELENLDSEE